MSSRPKTLLAFALSLAAGSAAAQTMTAPVTTAPEGMSGTGAVGGASIGGAASPTTTMTGMTPTITASPGLAAPSAQISAGNTAAIMPGAAAVPTGLVPAGGVPSPTVPGRTSARNVPGAVVPSPAVDGAPAKQPFSSRSTAAGEAPALANGVHSPAALAGSHSAAAPGGNRDAAARPTAGAALDGTAKTAEVHYKLALTYDDKLKNPLGAMHHFQRYLELKPSGPHAKDARNFVKEDELKLVATLSQGALMSQDDPARKQQQEHEHGERVEVDLAVATHHVDRAPREAGNDADR